MAGLTGGADAAKKQKHSDTFPLTGSVSLNPSMSAGTLYAGPTARPGVDFSLGYSARLAFAPGFGLNASQFVTKSIVTNADSGAARPYDTTAGDIVMGLQWSPRFADDKGVKKPLMLPGGIRVGTNVQMILGVSRSSRYVGRLGQIGPVVNLSRGFLGGKLSTVAGIAFLKNINRAVGASVPVEDGTALARLNGPELLAGGFVLTGQNVTSHAVRYVLSANLDLGSRWSVSATYLLFNNFRQFDAPDDQYTAKYGRVGRGRTDSQWGILGVNYNVDEAGHWSAALSGFTASAPFSADNKTLRFPFWDFRSPQDNLSAINASLSFAF